MSCDSCCHQSKSARIAAKINHNAIRSPKCGQCIVDGCGERSHPNAEAEISNTPGQSWITTDTCDLIFTEPAPLGFCGKWRKISHFYKFAWWIFKGDDDFVLFSVGIDEEIFRAHPWPTADECADCLFTRKSLERCTWRSKHFDDWVDRIALRRNKFPARLDPSYCCWTFLGNSSDDCIAAENLHCDSRPTANSTWGT